jgi:hypothetical protein
VERYRVTRREALIAFIDEALETSGCKRLGGIPDPRLAPFVFSAEMPWGESLDLICYAFLANKYRGAGRPLDEHRFQVKYGSDFKRFHEIYLPQKPSEVTLMFGVHLEARVVVAVDPAMHNPTWFSRSVEFKSDVVDEIRRTGWCGWERERKQARRRHMPQDNYQTEVLLGLTAENFARYVLLEKNATGIPPGERLLLLEKRQLLPEQVVEPHALEIELGLPTSEILEMIGDAKRLLVAVRGRAAEKHLARVLKAEPAIESVKEIDADGEPDFVVGYRGRAVRIECKNTLRRQHQGCAKVDFQKTRASKSDPCSRYYRPEQFEVLAACLHPISERWEFRFCPTSRLTPHPKCAGHLSQHVLVNDRWTNSIVDVLESVAT